LTLLVGPSGILRVAFHEVFYPLIVLVCILQLLHRQTLSDYTIGYIKVNTKFLCAAGY
jgi:hypothetical protein